MFLFERSRVQPRVLDGRKAMLARLINSTLRLFFRHFYHGLAWSYDVVAAAVSLGHWNDWILSVRPLLRGPLLLELGYGPGHLQQAILAEKIGIPVGLDESFQMSTLARRRLKQSSAAWPNLARGIAQHLPFTSCIFDIVVATFPTEFIFEPTTLSEIRRVLKSEGQLLIVPGAWIVGRKLVERGAAWLFKITGQAPASPHAILEDRLRVPLEEAGFGFESKMLELHGSLVMIVIAAINAP